ncbi:hypothetical protein BCR36DRAFT_26262 [Piromyces finnis]|uniref:At4g15545-like C-terminal domain-containing protein n=1 Tax=Piromyces finnis TaxID=1754191 RepID=A0A1Y1VFD3_9FUNG|nr:hypothetical protein BCR36DRAFT_26262 [Piromyces finnis]|eukprot:ORX53445.1 hypothetical protein BCR36DRAFT_26262 [Piromyces finnis]
MKEEYEQNQDEINQWKEIANVQKTKINSLENTVTELNNKIIEMEKIISSQQAEKRVLITTKNSIIEKYNALRKNAAQLESFRKSIVSMVEVTPQSSLQIENDTFPDSLELEQLDTQIPANKSVSFFTPNDDINNSIFNIGQEIIEKQQLISPNSTYNFDNSIIGNNKNNTINKKISESQNNKDIEIASKLANLDNSIIDSSYYLKHNVNNPANKNNVNSNNNNNNSNNNNSNNNNNTILNSIPLQKIDASQLYKKIKESLQESEFEEFASNITNFNNGTQSADETVRNIGQVIKNRNLFIQMRTLIYKALAENTFSINSVSQSSINVK